MPAPTPVPLRQQMLRLLEQGLNAAQVARQLGRPERTVRRLLARPPGPGGLAPSYDHTAHRACPLPPGLRAEALDLAQRHPSWGATYLLVRLRQRHPDTPWPTPRTLQRWLGPVRPAPARPGRKPASESRRAAWPHDTWQVDAADQLRLAGGRPVCWLRVADECSGAFLHTKVFPPGPLQPGAGGRGAGRTAVLLRALGAAAGGAGGQRQPLGHLE
jgi:Homeodomain-like domain